MRDKPSIEKRVGAGFVIAVVILLVVTAASAWNASRFAATFRWVDHTHQVLYNLERVLTGVLQIQSSSLAYLATGDIAQIDTHDQALGATERSVRQIRGLTRDNASQQRRLNEFDQQFRAFMELTRQRHALRPAGNLNAPELQANLLRAQTIVDALTLEIRTMEREERHLLDQRSWAFQGASRATIALTIVAGLLAIAFLLLGAARVRRDLRRRRIAERQFEERFRIAGDAMVVLSPTGRILRLNPAWTSILGFHVDDLRGRTLEDMVHPEDRESAREQVRLLQEKRTSASFEARHQTAGGAWRHFQWNVTPSSTRDVLYGAARDITDHKDAIKALHKSAEDIRDLYNLAPCGYHSLDAEGRFVSINDTELAWLGYTREELIGRVRFSDLLKPEGKIVFRENFNRFKVLGTIADLEFEVVRKDGSTFPVALSATAIRDASGAFIASRSTLFDITDRKRTDQQIRTLNLDLQLQNARLEIANKELESFSYSVSHDLRAPLRHIDGFASLLSKHAGPSLDEKGRRFITVISDSAKRMGRLIDDLLAFSRMGRVQMDETDINQNELIDAVIRDCNIPPERQIDWQIAPLPKVRADAPMLRQVWFNLIDNAVKYTAHAKPAVIEIGSRQDAVDQSEMVFFIKDNGVGFDMKYAVKLFGVFQRLHSEAEFEGTGIGLANVRRIVTRHGGRTWAESAVGAGSTFYFSLPVSSRSTPAS